MARETTVGSVMAVGVVSLASAALGLATLVGVLSLVLPAFPDLHWGAIQTARSMGLTRLNAGLATAIDNAEQRIWREWEDVARPHLPREALPIALLRSSDKPGQVDLSRPLLVRKGVFLSAYTVLYYFSRLSRPLDPVCCIECNCQQHRHVSVDIFALVYESVPTRSCIFLPPCPSCNPHRYLEKAPGLFASELALLPLSLKTLQQPPLSEVVIDYFANASKVGLVPESRGKVGDIVRNITRGGPAKISSQYIIMAQPVQNLWLHILTFCSGQC